MKKILTLFVLLLFIVSCSKDTERKEDDYPVQPVSFTSVDMTGDFWAPKIKRNQEVTIPTAFGKLRETGRIKNFKIAAGLEEGSFQSPYPFDDSDVCKVMEGASYSLQSNENPELEAYLDTVISYMAGAQEEDGYLYTNRTIMGDSAHQWAGDERWVNTYDLSHELYNLGHMFEAAVAHYRATGKRNFLDVAIKAADLVDEVFGRGEDQLQIHPGHQEIEIGLVRLYRVTGKKKYLDLAKFFLDIRGPDGEKYDQSHKRVVNQEKAVGHSVRAAYMYTGMADVAALTNNKDYVDAINKIWKDVVHKKYYVTGGIGASGGHEGFGPPYNLPNMSAYCETCASIANVFWNHRMYMHKGEEKYYDVLERTMYNALLSGISLSGDRFFYPNPLASDGDDERQEWFGCACCPSNMTRFLPSVPKYIYSKKDNSLMVNLYAENNADIELNGEDIEISQETNYPWEGKVELTVNPDRPHKFNIKLRIPGWARDDAVPGDLYRFIDSQKGSVELKLNGEDVNNTIEDGYIELNRNWESGDKIVLNLPMEIRKIKAREEVEADRGKFAIQRGPIVYAAEWPDNPEGNVLSLVIDEKSEFTSEFKPDKLNGVTVIRGEGSVAKRTLDNGITLTEEKQITLIPYHTWANRGPGEMSVWLAHEKQAARPLPAPTKAAKAEVSASTEKTTLKAINDQLEPESSDESPNYNWWSEEDTIEWVQYNFEQPAQVNNVKVYWFDDGPEGGCRVPESWKILYKNNGDWKEVNNKSPYKTKKDTYNEVNFEEVTTSALRLQVKLPEDNSSGILEWVVE